MKTEFTRPDRPIQGIERGKVREVPEETEKKRKRIGWTYGQLLRAMAKDARDKACLTQTNTRQG